MPSDPFTFTPCKVYGAPSVQWRPVRLDSGGVRVEWRELPEGVWREASSEFCRDEIVQGTEAGDWLVRLRAAGLLA